MTDQIKYEAQSMQLNDEDGQWVGHVLMESSGGIKRSVYITNGTYETPTKAENAAVVEFAAHLSQALANDFSQYTEVLGDG